MATATSAAGWSTLGGLEAIARAAQAPAFVSSDRPQLEHGLQIGDVTADRAIVWSRADRASELVVEWDRSPDFSSPTVVRGSQARPTLDFTARVDLQGLPAGEEIFLRTFFDATDSKRGKSEPLFGRFRTPPAGRRAIRFVWSGDTCGQGWGINPDLGGMTIYRTMLADNPDFFIHSGDNIYADAPLRPTVKLPDGSIWKNGFLDREPSKQKVAQTLDEFRACYRYNLCDENMRAFNAEVPQIWQWDDHETVNNWYASKILSTDKRYGQKKVQALAARSNRAFLEYSPMRWHADGDRARIYRHIPYGSALDIFVIDTRSYRGPNSHNTQTARTEETAFLAQDQLRWLKEGLKSSTARWKIIASNTPLSLVIQDGKDGQGRPRYENVANGDGDPLGRELELAELLSFMKENAIRDVVWLTGDVHYTAALEYHPNRAQFQDFDPFWEFVAGPLNAGTNGPRGLDNTFGPQVAFQNAARRGENNLPPTEGLQFYGQVDIEPDSQDMVVTLKDLRGQALFSKRLSPSPGPRAATLPHRRRRT